MELTRAQKSLIASLHTRHGRKKSSFCLCEGARAVSELLHLAPEQIEFIVGSTMPENLGNVKCYLVSEEEFSQLSGTVNSQGIMALARAPEFKSADVAVAGEFVIALDRVADPGNFGTICRTARAAGIKELWLTDGTVDPFGEKTIRAGMASQFGMSLRRFADLSELAEFSRASGYDKIFLAEPSGGENCFVSSDLYDHSVLVIGNEAHGVSEVPGARRVTIPMPGEFESLNAACAAVILIYEYVRRSFSH